MGRVFPRRGRVLHLVKKIDFRNPGEGFILKFFKWENPGRKIRGRVFPITTPVKQEMKEEQEQEPMDVGVVKSDVIIEKPIHISLGGGETVEYRCGNCDITPTRSKAGMDADIRSVHTKKALLCSFCAFSMYNFDSLNRHMKEHN